MLVRAIVGGLGGLDLNAREEIRAFMTDPVLQQRLAKYLVLQCFRNSTLEDLHAGIPPPSASGDFSALFAQIRKKVSDRIKRSVKARGADGGCAGHLDGATLCNNWTMPSTIFGAASTSSRFVPRHVSYPPNLCCSTVGR